MLLAGRFDGLAAQFQYLRYVVDSAQMHLAQQKKEFEARQRWVEQSNKLQAPTVDLDVGGTRFRTTPQTLSYEADGMLKVLISGDFVMEAEVDGSLFIDRDPLQFAHILSYLREPEAFTPPFAAHERNALLRDAAYYCLRRLSQGMRAFMQPTPMRFTGFDTARYRAEQSGALLKKCSHSGPRMAVGSPKMEHGRHSWRIVTSTPLIAIGVVNTNDHRQLQPGSDLHSWMMYGRPAELWHSHEPRAYGRILNPGDVVQVELDFDRWGGCLLYSINGQPQGIAWHGIGGHGPFYPAVYIYSKSGCTCSILDYTYPHPPFSEFLHKT